MTKEVTNLDCNTCNRADCAGCMIVYGNELKFDPNLISRCNNNSHFEAGNTIVREAKRTFFRFYEMFEALEELTPEQKELIESRKQDFKSLVQTAYTEELRRRAEYVPVSVAGPARYPATKMEKRVDKLMERRCEWGEKIEHFLENTSRMLRDLTPIEDILNEYRNGKWKYGEAIASDDPYAIEKLSAKLEYLKNYQERMKSENKAAKADKRSLPHPSWELSNNNANIKSTEKRIAELNKHRTQQAIEGFSFDGGSVAPNYDIDRLQIFFDSKPDEDMRTSLKGNGFRWSPREGAWQRQLTENALYAAKILLLERGRDR